MISLVELYILALRNVTVMNISIHLTIHVFGNVIPNLLGLLCPVDSFIRML